MEGTIRLETMEFILEPRGPAARLTVESRTITVTTIDFMV
jgi:hypothetical protein